jgi:hypothetical protein
MKEDRFFSWKWILSGIVVSFLILASMYEEVPAGPVHVQHPQQAVVEAKLEGLSLLWEGLGIMFGMFGLAVLVGVIFNGGLPDIHIHHHCNEEEKED